MIIFFIGSGNDTDIDRDDFFLRYLKKRQERLQLANFFYRNSLNSLMYVKQGDKARIGVKDAIGIV